MFDKHTCSGGRYSRRSLEVKVGGVRTRPKNRSIKTGRADLQSTKTTRCCCGSRVFFAATALIFVLTFGLFACTDTGRVTTPVEEQPEVEVIARDEEKAPPAPEEDNPIRDFLCSGEVLSTSDAIGAGYPELYYFTPGGTFAYQTHQYGVREEEQLISQRGEWSLEGDMLALKILSETRAHGGEITEDHHLGEILTGYELIRSDDGYRVSYRVTLEDAESESPYMTWDGEPIYMLFIPEENYEELRFLAESGNGNPIPASLEERGNSAGNIINDAWIMKSGNVAFLTQYANLPEIGYALPLVRVDALEDDWFKGPDWDREIINIPYLLLDLDVSGLNIQGDWIYYINWLEQSRIYRMSQDGSECTRLNDDSSRYISLVNNWIYFINLDDGEKIYRMRPDGSERSRIGNDAADYLNVSGDWAYFSNKDAGGAIYKVRTDGSEIVGLNAHSSSRIVVECSWIYYRNDEDYRIYRMRIDGSDITQLSDDRVNTLNVDHEWVFYSFLDENGLARLNHDGSGRQVFGADHDELYKTGRINIVWNHIYFINTKGNWNYYRMHLDGSNLEKMY